MEGPPSDATLLAGVAERDIGALRALYERHAGWLALRLARRCNDRDLVGDAVQDTFVAGWPRPRGVRGDGEVRARRAVPGSTRPPSRSISPWSITSQCGTGRATPSRYRDRRSSSGC